MDGFVYCVADLETSGIRVENNRILSVAASCRGKEFSSFVNPCMRIPPAATKVNGISDDDVKDSPKWDVVGPRLWAWLEERRIEAGAHTVVLVAHNASFDCSFIRAEMARLPFIPPGPPKMAAVDTLRIARSRLVTIPRHRQCDVYEHLFHEQPGDQHSAVGDVTALTRICEHPIFARALPSFRVPFKVDFPLAAKLPSAFVGGRAEMLQRGSMQTEAHQMVTQQPDPAQHPPTPESEQLPITSASAMRCEACKRIISKHFKHACRCTI